MILRRATALFALLLATLQAASTATAAAPTTTRDAPPQASRDIATLIETLGHPDPLQRATAEKALLDLGSDAREAVRAATTSDDPEIAGRARAVLQKLPWALPGDSPIARQLLSRYGASENERNVVIAGLVRNHEIGVLLRLLDEEPQAEVRWQIVSLLARYEDLELDRRLKSVAPDADNAPLLFLAAAHAPRTDRQRIVALCRRVIELESIASAPALDKVFLAYAQLILDCMERDDYPAAAALLRQQRRTAAPSSQAFHESMGSLLALQAYYGPLPGYRADVRAATGRPVLSDAFIGLYETLSLSPPPALAIWAQLRSPLPLELRYFSAWFVYRRHMTDHARAEFTLFADQYAVAAQTPVERGAPSQWNYPEMAAQAHEQLARITGEDNDDRAAADHLRRAAAIRQRDDDGVGNGELAIRVPGIAAIERARATELHWRELRAARSVGDRDKLREHLDALKDTTPANTDIVLDVVPLLKETGQPAAARAMFEKTYARLRELVDADPEEPEPMNNLAWLCARSGERLDEALKLATRAITLDPDNAAYLDTAAEANFRAGNIDEAIRLETKGLESRPNDKFMREQLERFKAAKKK